jgi:hypothetical protein
LILARPLQLGSIGYATGTYLFFAQLTRSREPEHGSTRSGLLRAAQEVGGPMSFSTVIFVFAYLPLFTMRGVEHAIFSPMSHTYAYCRSQAHGTMGPSHLINAEPVKQIDAKLTHELPGVTFNYSQNIEDNVNEALS